VALGTLAAGSAAHGAESAHLDDDRMAVLVDLTACVGCRRCEWACGAAHGSSGDPLDSYDDPAVFEHPRRPTADHRTVVNRVEDAEGKRDPIHLKVQCMHCERPACVSACLVGAMRKDPKGPVTWDPDCCIGCRYCMVACPFQNLAYEFDEPVAPRVSKCDFCRERTQAGQPPACVEACPVEALQFGRRRDLLERAHDRIRRHPDRYVDHVYGETEGGGLSWLYLSDRPFSEVGLPELGPESPADRSERIQHGIFRGFAAPLLLAGLLATLHKVTQRGAAS
jgi:Fe-S-cluster-containing dehydrogenase component